jgi:hypothetical protein
MLLASRVAVQLVGDALTVAAAPRRPAGRQVCRQPQPEGQIVGGTIYADAPPFRHETKAALICSELSLQWRSCG